jgi:hypothetical protein
MRQPLPPMARAQQKPTTNNKATSTMLETRSATTGSAISRNGMAGGSADATTSMNTATALRRSSTVTRLGLASL